MLKWVKSKISEDIPMNNFTSDWSDGRAITALVHAIDPGLYSDVKPEDLDPKDAKNNVQKAISVAELHLGIPAVSFGFFFFSGKNKAVEAIHTLNESCMTDSQAKG